MDVVFLSAIEQMHLLRSGRISPLELADEYIARIERLNPLLKAFVDFDPERIRKQARAAKTGTLCGLPISIKASISTADHRCEIGSLLHQGQAPARDALAVAALRDQGAVILGTTNCPEFLMAYETDNRLHGRTSNPWALDRTAGGSSGGEAAAIAAGLSAAGLGSDSGGSVRVPAHFTGICAFKPTSGRISPDGHLPPCVGPFAKLGAIGPMARSIEDIELLFQIINESSAIDLLSAPVPFHACSLGEAKALSIGYFEDDGLLPVTSETRVAIAEAVSALQRAGFRVQPFRPRFLEDARKLWTTFFMQCGAMFYAPTIAGREPELSPVFKEFLQMADGYVPLTAQTLLAAWAEWDQLSRRILEEMRSCPVLLLPVCAVPAFRHGERHWSVDGRQVSYLDVMRYTQWFNLLGTPAAVVPVGQSAEGLPIGVQIAGRPYEDEYVLAIARVLDCEFGYRVPPLA